MSVSTLTPGALAVLALTGQPCHPDDDEALALAPLWLHRQSEPPPAKLFDGFAYRTRHPDGSHALTFSDGRIELDIMPSGALSLRSSCYNQLTPQPLDDLFHALEDYIWPQPRGGLPCGPIWLEELLYTLCRARMRLPLLSVCMVPAF